MPKHSISLEDINKVLSLPIHDKFKLAILISYKDGLRIGEICHLRLEHLEFDKNLYRLETQKNGILRGSRYMSESVKNILKHYISKYKIQIKQHNDYIIFSRKHNSDHVHPEHLSYMFTRKLRSLGIEHTFEVNNKKMATNSFHSLRARSINDYRLAMLRKYGVISQENLMLHSGHTNPLSLKPYEENTDEMVLLAGKHRESIEF